MNESAAAANQAIDWLEALGICGVGFGSVFLTLVMLLASTHLSASVVQRLTASPKKP